MTLRISGGSDTLPSARRSVSSCHSADVMLALLDALVEERLNRLDGPGAAHDEGRARRERDHDLFQAQIEAQ
jgi:hypothetical protein